MSRGMTLAFLTALISGVAVFVNKFAVTKNIDPYQFTTLKNVLVAVILSMVVLLPTVFKKRPKIGGRNWLKLLAIGVIGGSFPFLLFFKGLSLTSAAMGGFIHKTLFIWASILAWLFLKEKIKKIQWLALAMLLVGVILVVGVKAFTFGGAELMILAATLLWSVENVIAKKILQTVNYKIVAWARMFFGAIILLAYLSFTSGFPAIFTLSLTKWFWIALSVLLLSGYVLTWYRALQQEKVSVVTSVLVLAFPLTTILEALHKQAIPSGEVWLGIILNAVAIGLLVWQARCLPKKLSVNNAVPHL